MALLESLPMGSTECPGDIRSSPALARSLASNLTARHPTIRCSRICLRPVPVRQLHARPDQVLKRRSPSKGAFRGPEMTEPSGQRGRQGSTRDRTRGCHASLPCLVLRHRTSLGRMFWPVRSPAIARVFTVWQAHQDSNPELNKRTGRMNHQSILCFVGPSHVVAFMTG